MLTIKVYKRRFIYPIFAGQMDKVVSAYPNNIQNVCYDSIFGNVEVMNIITLVCFALLVSLGYFKLPFCNYT